MLLLGIVIGATKTEYVEKVLQLPTWQPALAAGLVLVGKSSSLQFVIILSRTLLIRDLYTIAGRLWVVEANARGTLSNYRFDPEDQETKTWVLKLK